MCLCASQHDTLLSTARPNNQWFWKAACEERVITYYSNSVKQQLEAGAKLEHIGVNFRHSVPKPLHAQWLVNMYNFFFTEREKLVITKHWNKAGISGLFDGTTVVLPEDPSENITVD